MKTKTEKPRELQVNVKLIGEEVTRFESFKNREHIRAGAEAVRKLIFDRLDQLQKTEPAA